MKQEDREKEGLFIAIYTKDGYFLKVKPAYSIHKIKYSFVKLGTNGQGFDIYMDIDVFDNLVDDILSFRLYRAIEEERAKDEQYPSAFTYTTGEKGTKCIAIGHGKHGVLVQGTEDKKNYARVPCSYDDLRTMAKYYRRTCEQYFNGISEKIIKNAAQWREADPDSEDTTAPSASSDTQKETETSTGANKPCEERYTFHTQGALADGKVKVKIDGFNQIGTLIFPKNSQQELSWYNKFMDATQKESKNLTCICTRNNEEFTFIKCETPKKK